MEFFLGIQFREVVEFGRQFGLALTGAAALWGLVFVFAGKKENNTHKCIIYEWISERLLLAFSGAASLTFISWYILLLILPAEAHEGITLYPDIHEKLAALDITMPLYIVWLLFLIAGVIARFFRPSIFRKKLGTFFLINFLFAFGLISFTAWTGEWSPRQIFIAGHAFHSIFTLGTVIILDFLFLTSKSSDFLKQHIFPFFPTISKVIWIGLGIDFISVSLVFNDAIVFTEKFFWMQTAIGIVIINGVLLSGPIARKILGSIKLAGNKLTKKWVLIADISGVISISGWFTNTFIDYFENLTLSFMSLALGYIALVAILFFGHLVWEKFDRNKPNLLVN